MANKKYFYDTCALLDLQSKVLEDHFLISNITLMELESIKSSGTKDEETKWSARRLLHLLEENEDKYEVISYNTSLCDELIAKHNLLLNNDSRIIVSAFALYEIDDSIVFVTSDLACKAIAKSIGLPVEKTSSAIDEDDYTGFKRIEMNNLELADFYSKLLQNNINKYSLKDNEYLLIIDSAGEIIDKYKWKEGKYFKIPFLKLESSMFGKICPKDSYQQIAIDSLTNNQITILRGKAGSGKSYLALAYLMSLLESNKIDKILIFVNNTAVKGAARLGFLPGTKEDKLLDSQIGNFLSTKLGSMTEVEKMIDQEKLILVPVADCRGMDTTGMNAGVLVTEAQNLSRDMIKLLLQRIGEDSVVIFEGDDRTQVDMAEYAGTNNGLRGMSRAFRGESIYGEVTLQSIYRSKIAQIAERI